MSECKFCVTEEDRIAHAEAEAEWGTVLDMFPMWWGILADMIEKEDDE